MSIFQRRVEQCYLRAALSVLPESQVGVPDRRRLAARPANERAAEPTDEPLGNFRPWHRDRHHEDPRPRRS